MELSQKQTQNLTLTPELSQSLNILQYSTYELVDFIQQQVVENPVLEVREKSYIKADLHPNYRSRSKISGNQDFDPLLHYSQQNRTLEQHLMEQVVMLPNMTPIQLKMLTFLIGNLNQYGYLEMEPAIAARIFSVSLLELEEVIGILQSLDPIGVGAKSLAQSLLIQLSVQSNPHPLAMPIVKKHMDDLAVKNYRKIAKLLNASLQDVQEAEDYIKTLNPRPCSEYQYEMTQYVAPDVIIKIVNNMLQIVVNDALMPELTINQHYGNELKKMDCAHDFLKEKYHEAMILINGISQRNRTLFKVAKAIIERQSDFLLKGLSALAPMTLRDISEQIGYHESTISRATSNKYIQTPHGIFLLRSLFTAGVNKSNGLDTESSTSVKEKIKTLIANENKQKPFSDQQLVLLLEKYGILLSRRTVAKYREEIGIPGSSKRRRF